MFSSLLPILLLSGAGSVTPARASPTLPDGAALPSGDSATWRNAMTAWSPEEQAQPSGQSALQLSKPVATGLLTSTFGVRTDPLTGQQRAHRGLDIAGRLGAPVVASAGGTVSFAGAAGGYGLMVQIDRPDGVQVRYGHLSRIFARAGEVVRTGDPIGAMGSTGRSTGSHLHFEVRIDGLAVDPLRPLPFVAAPAESADAAPVAQRWQGYEQAADRLPAAFR